MSSASQSGTPVDLPRAAVLKQQLSDFVTKGALRERYQQHQKLLLELCDAADEGDHDSILDSFLFDWLDERGEGAIDHFLKSAKITDADRSALREWEDSIHSVFEITSARSNNLILRDLDSGDTFDVTAGATEHGRGYEKGGYLAARLLPLGDYFILSGPRCLLPDRESALEALKISSSFEQLDSPESLENAQREQHAAFKEFFGCDEVTTSPVELKQTLEKFQRYILFERRDPKDNSTLAERFHCAFGRSLKMPLLPSPPAEFGDVGEVTVLCDEFDGIVFLPDYNAFQRVFDSGDPDSDSEGWHNLMWRYVKDPGIPLVAFERVAEQKPARVEGVLRTLLGDDSFSIEHLYAMLLHYKDPVEGLEDLKDEARLWDMLNGSTSAETAPAAPKVRARAARVAQPNRAKRKSPIAVRKAARKRRPASAKKR